MLGEEGSSAFVSLGVATNAELVTMATLVELREALFDFCKLALVPVEARELTSAELLEVDVGLDLDSVIGRLTCFRDKASDH